MSCSDLAHAPDAPTARAAATGPSDHHLDQTDQTDHAIDNPDPNLPL